jgi:hypothetical protein
MLAKSKGDGPLADEISYSCAYIVIAVQLIAVQNYATGDKPIDPKQDEIKLATSGQRGYRPKRS